MSRILDKLYTFVKRQAVFVILIFILLFNQIINSFADSKIIELKEERQRKSLKIIISLYT